MDKIKYLDEWTIAEPVFSENYLGKFEAIMSMGNGYLGIRNVHEEKYTQETRDMFVAGVFDKFSDSEVSELANLPDVTNMNIFIDGERFTLISGELHDYQRTFCYKTGESIRTFIWSDEGGRKLKFKFCKFVSMANKHLFMLELHVENLGKNVNLTIDSGIDGTKTNSGSQHFEEGDRRYFENKFLHLKTCTINSKNRIAVACCNYLAKEHESSVTMGRRQIKETISLHLPKNEDVTVTKYSLVRTERDLEADGQEYLNQEMIDELSNLSKLSYDELLHQTQEAWNEIWQKGNIEIQSEDFHDALLLNFARYHMHIMAPTFDDRLNIGAKGLSGEGYKGHTFWDTEIYILPYFIYMYPKEAKSLVNYRIKGLIEAKKNAEHNGYKGAQYPWESAWLSDGETTPDFIGIDIITGMPTPVLTGKLEHHITGDVVYGILEYLTATGDLQTTETFFDVLMNAAIFWTSRANYNSELDRYDILDVIGPDEYKEHVNNNAYTNYLAKYTLNKAIEAYSKSDNEKIKNCYRSSIKTIREVEAKLYQPKVNKENILPQDDSFLQKKTIDLSKYLNSERVGILFSDYSQKQVNQMQICKQADVLLLMLLFSGNFSKVELIDNWNYYYPKTVHDSSLSLSTHCNFALLIDQEELAYELFQKSFNIDLGDHNMTSSNSGIHAASMGGIWQNVVKGFGGFSFEDGIVQISPKLPKKWHELTYEVNVQKARIKVKITHEEIRINLLEGTLTFVKIESNKYQFYKNEIKVMRK